MSGNPIVFTVTVIDTYRDKTIGIRRTPVVFTNLQDAWYCVRNNLEDLSDGGQYQYAVIERTELNVIRPQLNNVIERWTFKYNSVLSEFEPAELPTWLSTQSGFGIG